MLLGFKLFGSLYNSHYECQFEKFEKCDLAKLELFCPLFKLKFVECKVDKF